MKLYEIKEAYNGLLELEEQGVDVSEYLAQVEGEIEDKLQNIGLVYKTLSAEAEAIKAEEKKLSDRRKSLENKASSIKEWLYSEMQQLHIEKVNKPNIVLSIAKNPPKLVLDETKIPLEYQYTETIVSIDKSMIREDLKAGKVVQGAELVQDTSLRIK